MLEEIRKNTPEDAEIIDQLAGAHVFFVDGQGVILPSGRRVTGEGMRALISEAGYDPLTRDGDRNNPESSKHWRNVSPVTKVTNTIIGGTQHGPVIQSGDMNGLNL